MKEKKNISCSSFHLCEVNPQFYPRTVQHLVKIKIVNWSNNMKMTLAVKEVTAVSQKLSGINGNKIVTDPCLP